MSTASEATLILTALSRGDRSQVDRLMELVYGELRGLARRYLGRRPAQQPLQPTELVHEAFLKLVGHEETDWRGRSHFYAVAATAMRQILVDEARKRLRVKRGGGQIHISLDEQDILSSQRDEDVLAVHEVLTRLSAAHPRRAQLVELRFFGRMSLDEVAEALGLSTPHGAAGLGSGPRLAPSRAGLLAAAPMTRVTEIFGDARDLRGDERDAFLARACADDPELRDEVESLLAYHRPDTVTDVTGIRAQPGRKGWGTFRRRRAVALAALISSMVLAILGFIVSGIVHRRLQQELESELRTSLQASVATYRGWIESWRSELMRWADHPEVRSGLRELTLAAQGRDVSARELQSLESHKRLVRVLEPLTTQGEVDHVHATNRENVIVYFGARDFGDRVYRLSAAGGRLNLPVFVGESVVSAPHAWGANIGADPSRDVAQIVIAAPVHDDDGGIIAALSLRFIDPDIARFLQNERLGPRSNTYAINAQSVLVSRSRYEDELMRAGLVPDGASSVLHVSARNPGGDVTKGFEPPDPPTAWPRTRMATLAATGEPGIDLDGYRDFRGREVVGAWEWIPEYNVGVATELETGVAYGTVTTLQTAFAVLVGLLLAVASYAFLSTLSMARLRQHIVEAERLGQYRLEEPIGAGGMATIYRAHHVMLERPVAIKLLRGEPALRVAPDSLARFKREVKLVSRLHHRNTIQIFDYGQTSDGSLFFVMELVSGINLTELVQREGALAAERAVFILSQICDALRDAHRHGIVHRDIKPANVMVSGGAAEPDVVKVLDFGLARTVSLSSTQITQQHLLGGTPAYIAPERIRSPERIDPSSDIYAVGAVAFYLLTGHELIEGGAPEEILMKAMAGAQARPSSIATTAIPEELDVLVLECLARDPEGRPDDMDAVLNVFGEIARIYPWSEDEARAWWARYRETWEVLPTGNGVV